jgi:hypothetical protein
VEFIHEKAGDAKYLVLSDQMVSVAALRRFGFENLPYALPTGSRRYEYFLTLAHGEPSRATLEAAMDEFGVDRQFFVMNDYYADLAYFRETLEAEADHAWLLSDGSVLILDFLR